MWSSADTCAARRFDGGGMFSPFPVEHPRARATLRFLVLFCPFLWPALVQISVFYISYNRLGLMLHQVCVWGGS